MGGGGEGGQTSDSDQGKLARRIPVPFPQKGTDLVSQWLWEAETQTMAWNESNNNNNHRSYLPSSLCPYHNGSSHGCVKYVI